MNKMAIGIIFRRIFIVLSKNQTTVRLEQRKATGYGAISNFFVKSPALLNEQMPMILPCRLSALSIIAFDTRAKSKISSARIVAILPD